MDTGAVSVEDDERPAVLVEVRAQMPDCECSTATVPPLVSFDVERDVASAEIGTSSQQGADGVQHVPVGNEREQVFGRLAFRRPCTPAENSASR